MDWYRRNTHLIIDNPSHRADQGFQSTGGVVEVLTQCVADDYDMVGRAKRILRASTTPCPEALDLLVNVRDRCFAVLRQVNREHRLPESLPSTSCGTRGDHPSTSPLNTYETNTSSTPIFGTCENLFSPQYTHDENLFTQHMSDNFISPQPTIVNPVDTHHSVEPVVEGVREGEEHRKEAEDGMIEDEVLTEVDHMGALRGQEEHHTIGEVVEGIEGGGHRGRGQGRGMGRGRGRGRRRGRGHTLLPEGPSQQVGVSQVTQLEEVQYYSRRKSKRPRARHPACGT